jgi:pyrroline-5-carboxylate reductase
MTTLSSLKICFIGGGNMASALIGGLIKKGVQNKNISVADPFLQTRQNLENNFQISAKEKTSELHSSIESADVVVLAVKPQQFKEAALELANVLASCKTKPFCLSVAAGIRTQDMARWLTHNRLVRAMPNTPALISQGMTGLFASPEASAEDKKIAAEICQAVGQITWVENEKQIDDITAVSGSGPAYVFAFLEALEAAAIHQGLSSEQSRLLAIQTVQGAASLAAQSEDSPSTLREKVTSKGGTTYAALQVLEKQSWAKTLQEAIAAASNRGAEMGDEFGKQ